MGIIEIEGMEFYAYHGCFEEEQLVGNKFIVDLKMEYDISEAANCDLLEKTIDYQKIYAIVSQEMSLPSKLLEHVAGRISRAIHKSCPDIIRSELKVSKLNPPVGGKVDRVSVCIKKASM